MILKSFSLSTEDIIINCIDNHSKELVQRWMLKLHTTPKKPNKTISEEIRIGYDKGIKVPYHNRASEYCIFDVLSSHPHILRVFLLFLLIKIGYFLKVGYRC